MCTGHDYTQPDKPRIDWEDPDAKQALVSALVNDANALVAALSEADLQDGSEAESALALVAGQDVEPAEGSDGTDGRWRIARRVAEERIISTVDLGVRRTRSHRRRAATDIGRTRPPRTSPANGTAIPLTALESCGPRSTRATVTRP